MPEPAPVLRRAGAYFLDVLPILGMTLVVGLLFGTTQDMFRLLGSTEPADRIEFYQARNTLRDLAGLAYILLAMAFEVSRLGTTPGKLSTGMRPVDKFGQRPSTRRIMVRNFAKILSVLPFGLGLIWAFFDKQNRAWHDLIAGTYVATVSADALRTGNRSPGHPVRSNA